MYAATMLATTLLLLLHTHLPAATQAETLSATSHQTGIDALQTRRGCLSQPRLVCVLSPTRGNRVFGLVTFRPQFWAGRRRGEKCIVMITAKVRNLRKGPHGFHIHTYGDVRSTDGSSTGGHFTSPTGGGMPHGGPNDLKRHWGDFGNLTAWKKGTAAYKRGDRVVRIGGIVGRSMVVHALGDKGGAAQPSGDAGSRQASCVIGISNPVFN